MNENISIHMCDIQEIKPKFTKSSLIDDVNKNLFLCKLRKNEDNRIYYQVLRFTSDEVFERFDAQGRSLDGSYEILQWGRLPQG